MPDTTDPLIEAMADAYEAERAMWRVVPDTSSQWNDHGTMRYKRSWVINDMEQIPLRRSQRIHLSTENTKRFLHEQATQAALSVVKQHLTSAMLDVRTRAGSFERSGAVWEAYDKAILDCHDALLAALEGNKHE